MASTMQMVWPLVTRSPSCSTGGEGGGAGRRVGRRHAVAMLVRRGTPPACAGCSHTGKASLWAIRRGYRGVAVARAVEAVPKSPAQDW